MGAPVTGGKQERREFGTPVGIGGTDDGSPRVERRRPIDLLLPRLKRPKERRQGQWYAGCPTSAHARGDRSRGLSVRELDDGRLLLHCFAGCSPDEIVAALGLSFSDLFPADPDDPQTRYRGVRPRWPLRDVLLIVANEALVVHIGAEMLGRGEGLTQADRDRLTLAAGRIMTALDVAGVRNER